jgi:ATP-dependent DNA helicase DinG
MLEAHAHQQLKALLQQEGGEAWPHHLSLSRLVARSLRRHDHSLIRLGIGSGPSWWISLLVPLALSDSSLALVLSEGLRQRLLQIELPRLARAGLPLPCAEGPSPPPPGVLWLLGHCELVTAWRGQLLGQRQLILPEAEQLDRLLGEALAVAIAPHHWDQLRRALPRAEATLLGLHERLNRRILAAPRHPQSQVALHEDDEAPLRQLLSLLGPLPEPWPTWLQSSGSGWTSWAKLNPELLQWTLQRQPLDPLASLAGLLHGRGAVVIGQLNGSRHGDGCPAASLTLGLNPQVDVALGDLPLSDPLPVYAPVRQPLPNSPVYGDHLLEQCRRLVLGQERLSLILLDDGQLRRQLASGLAADFGSRVVHECTSPESHGVLCASWSWWLRHQEQLPLPGQVVVGLLPIASLEDPLTAARVTALRGQGRDWFRELLLPDALLRLQLGVAPLRRPPGGRLAILDGRLRSRSWGQRVLQSLEPWVSLNRLLPT